MAKGAIFGLGLMASASVAAAQEPAKPLFADDQLIQVTIRGPIGKVSGSDQRSTNVAATLVSGAETLPVRLSPRGITRLRKETCRFAPLRVDFTGAPTASSLFAGQRRLKLVTHCRPSESFQQHPLLEYAAYRLYNQVTPLSFRVRLAQINYEEDNGKPVASRYGFFIEDHGDVARRNGMREAQVGERIPVASLSADAAGRFAVFQYLIANLDWAMQAGPAGDTCCHNSRLVSASGGPPYATVPYDFDYSGFVDAPYAVPPEAVRVSSVKVRRYRGFCRHNAEALKAAAEMRTRQGEMLGLLATIPGLEDRTKAKASAFLAKGFADIANDEAVQQNLLKTCIG